MEENKNTERMLGEYAADAEIPAAEPQRQYYYMEKAKQHLARMSAEAGRPLTFCVTTFGCQMNARDSEKLTGILERIGYVEEPDEEKADLSSTIHAPCERTLTRESTDGWGSSGVSRRRTRI